MGGGSMRVNGNERLLTLMKILEEETDEENQLGMKELVAKLKTAFLGEQRFDTRAIKRDIQALDDSGFEVIINEGKFGKSLYSHQGRLFETYQLRLLSDAVLSARFITATDKQSIVKQLKNLTSKEQAKTLPDTLIFNPSSNIDYSLIRFNIDKVHEAVSNNKIIEYQYGKYNVHKEFTLNRDGEIYQTEPYALIWRNDFYYLIGRYLPTNEFRHYRLDRIRHIQVSDKTFRREKFDTSQYIDQSFHMFTGDDRWIKIVFENDLINMIIDRFGLDVDIEPIDDAHLLLTTKAKISIGLKSWIMRWGAKAKVISPPELAEDIVEEIQKMQERYE